MKPLVLLLSLMAFFPNAHGEIYRYIDEHGNTHFGDKKLSKKHVPIRFNGKGWVEIKYYKDYRKNRELFAPIIERAALKNGLSPALVHAVIKTESYYNPVIRSSAGAVGLMQLMPATASRFGVTNRRDPEQNIQAGAKYLKILLGQFNNDLSLALAAYNAGEGNVRRYGNQIPPFKETQNYVKKVLAVLNNHP